MNNVITKQNNLPWRRTILERDNLKIDLKDYILSNPYRENEIAMYDPNRGGIWTIRPNVIFTDEWQKYLTNTVGLTIDIAQIFFRKPYYQHPGAHVDIDRNDNLYGGGINWTLDPDDADMVWYDMPNVDPIYTKRSETDRNREWPLEILTEHARCTIGQNPTLVKTDIPHTIDMRANERWLISVRFNGLQTWDQYLNAFNKWMEKNV